MTQHDTPTLSYALPRRPNPWARATLIGGIILLLGAFVPICGLAVIPFAWAGLIAGLVGVSLAIWGRRRGLVMSVCGLMLCLAAAFIPLGMLSAVPLFAEIGLRVLDSTNQAPPARPSPAAAPATLPSAATMPQGD